MSNTPPDPDPPHALGWSLDREFSLVDALADLHQATGTASALARVQGESPEARRRFNEITLIIRRIGARIDQHRHQWDR